MTSTEACARNIILDTVISDLKHGDIEVPMLPEVASKVVRLTQNPESDALELAKLIQGDQTLAGHVMRVANSAAYSPNASMVSLQQAITRLGMRIISEIALAASINTSLFNTPGHEKHIQYVLNCSLAAGLWAKETARSCRKNVEAAFLAGLLNDIGRPVAVQSAIAASKKLNAPLSKDDIKEIELATKQKFGLAVLEQWEMPEAVKNVVSYFDRYDDDHEGQQQTMIVVAGTAIAQYFHCDDNESNCPDKAELLAHPVFAKINLYQDEVETLLEKKDAVNSAMEAMGL